MYRFTRTALAKSDTALEAVRFALEVNDLLQKKFPDANFQVFTRQFGQKNQVMWAGEFKDLTQVQAAADAIQGSGEHHGTLSRSADLFVEGSVQDALYRPIPKL